MEAPPSPDPLYVFRAHEAEVTCLHFHPSGATFFSGDGRGELRWWSLDTKRQTWQVAAHEKGIVKTLVADSNMLISQGREGNVKFWDLSSQKTTRVLETNFMGFCAFSFLKCSSGDLLACPTEDEAQIGIWDLTSGTIIARLKAEEKTGMCMGLKLFEGRLLAGYESGSVILWDVSSRKQVSSLRVAAESLLCMDFLRASTEGVCGSASNALTKLALSPSGVQCTESVSFNTPGIADVKIRSDEKIVATAGWDKRVRIFSWKKLRPLAILKYHTASVSSVEFSPTSNLLLSGSADKRIALWQIY